MATKEHAKQHREWLTEKYKSTDGYKRFPTHWTSHRVQVNPSLKNGSNLPRAGHPHKLSEKSKKKIGEVGPPTHL